MVESNDSSWKEPNDFRGSVRMLLAGSILPIVENCRNKQLSPVVAGWSSSVHFILKHCFLDTYPLWLGCCAAGWIFAESFFPFGLFWCINRIKNAGSALILEALDKKDSSLNDEHYGEPGILFIRLLYNNKVSAARGVFRTVVIQTAAGDPSCSQPSPSTSWNLCTAKCFWYTHRSDAQVTSAMDDQVASLGQLDSFLPQKQIGLNAGKDCGVPVVLKGVSPSVKLFRPKLASQC